MPYTQHEVALQLFEADLVMKLEERDSLRDRSDGAASPELIKLERGIAELQNEIAEMRLEIAKDH